MLHILNTTIRRVICHCEIRDCSVQHGAVLCNVRMFCVNGAVAQIFTEHLYQMLTFSQQVRACVSKLVFKDNFGGWGGGRYAVKGLALSIFQTTPHGAPR